MKVFIKISVFILVIPLIAFAVTVTIGFDTGYFYPAGIEHSDSSYIGYGDRNVNFGNKCHLADDYNKPEGSIVVAIDDGVVEEADTAFPFYGGDDGTPGGLLVIRHITSGGKTFHALYGHIKGLTVAKGDTVTAGQKIAVVGPFKSGSRQLPHLHFGINPTAIDKNGYTVSAACTNYRGYVDPEVFMKENYTVKGSCKAVNDSVTTVKNTLVTSASVLTNDTDVDGDTLSVSAADATSSKGVVITNNSDGTFTYTPKIDFVGSDSFNYTLSDGKGCTSQGKVSISVTNPDGSGGGDDSGSGSGDDSGSGGGNMGIVSLLSLLFISLFRRKNRLI